MIITRPDGTTETKGPITLDSTSSGWLLYTPTVVGTYYFQMNFPQQQYWINGTTNQDLYTYKADMSEKIPLIVQQDPVQGYTNSPPLPTDYWARPINAENKGWWQVADDWLMRGYDKTSRSFAGTPAFAPYTSAPDSAHILYSKPIVLGGIAGGKFGDISYYTGVSYEQYFEAMVLNGVVIYSEHGATTSGNTIGTRFFDLKTGEDYPLMYMNATGIQFAQKLNVDTPNEHGVLTYIVVSRGDSWDFYEILPDMQRAPSLQFTLSGMTGLTGTTVFGPNGEILSYRIAGNATHRYMTCFNASKAVLGVRFSGIDVWSPSGTINASRKVTEAPNAATSAEVAYWESVSNSPYVGIEWNVTLPDVDGVTQTVREVNVEEGWLLATATDSLPFPYVYSDVGYNIGQMKRGLDGKYPTTLAHTFAANRTMIHDIHDRISNHIKYGMYIRYDEGEEVYYAFSMQTGTQLWKTNPINNAWALFARNYEFAYNKLITSGFDGIIRAYDITNGNLLWSYNKGSAGFENAYGGYPEYAGFAIADGKVYTTSDEHSSDGVLWRGSSLWAIDIETGQLAFKVNGMYRHPVIADGVLIAINSYDGQVYAFGKGPSATTVSAPQTAVPKGTTVMITGTVTDQTPANKGTPAISDASMSAWMEYLHMTKTIPSNATGVPVKIAAIDCNTNAYTDLGTATSDMAGNFGFSWTPIAEGTYQIVASFDGSNSYGSSFSTTYMVVGPAASAAPTSTPTQTVAPTSTPSATVSASPTVAPTPGTGVSTETLLIAGAAVVIIIAVIAAALVLRKRK